MHTVYGIVCEYCNTDGSSYLFNVTIFFWVTENVKGCKLHIME